MTRVDNEGIYGLMRVRDLSGRALSDGHGAPITAAYRFPLENISNAQLQKFNRGKTALVIAVPLTAGLLIWAIRDTKNALDSFEIGVPFL